MAEGAAVHGENNYRTGANDPDFITDRVNHMIEHALKREIAFEEHPDVDGPVELNAHGFPVLKTRSAKRVASELVYQIMEQEGL